MQSQVGDYAIISLQAAAYRKGMVNSEDTYQLWSRFNWNCQKLKGKLDNSLKNVPEESILSLWKDCVNKAKKYKDEFLRNNLTIKPEEEKEDAEMASS